MTDESGISEGEAAILAVLQDLLAEVQALRADLAPKATYPSGVPWVGGASNAWQCPSCHGWTLPSSAHVCLGT
jgi:hypothetical protein